MKILHTTHSYPPDVSGVPEVVAQLSVRMAKHGHEVHVATACTGTAPAKEVLDGVNVHRFAISGNAVEGIRGDASSYVELARSAEWDVVAIHCVQAWPLDALLPHLKEVAAPKILVCHGLFPLGNPRYREYYDNLVNTFRSLDAVVGLSRLCEDTEFCASHGLPAPHIIPNGVNLEEWGGGATGLREKWRLRPGPWVLNVSNHNPFKGHAKFFRVVQEIRRRRPSAVGVLVGGHYPTQRWQLGKLGVQGGCWYKCRAKAWLHDDVVLKYGVPRADVVSAVKEAEIALVTSSWEASPLVVLECMAAGTPWVSFDVGCVREHKGGFVAESEMAMVEMACRLLEDADLRARVGEEGRLRAREKHDWERISVEYENLYERIVGEKRS